VVSKRRDDPHQPRRAPSWRKIRCAQRQELVVGAYTPEAGRRNDLGALLLGHYDDAGKLVYAGRVGTGFDAKTRSALLARLRPLRSPSSPFALPLAASEARDACFVRPELVVEVRFKEWTGKGRLRQAVYLGLREDKEAREVVREEPGGSARGRSRRAKAASGAGARETAPSPPVSNRARARSPRSAASPGGRVAGVVISHPERVIDPETGLTKLDLARYYEAVWPRIEPHLRDRALSVVRCPDGIAGHCFFQKHAFPQRVAGVRAVESDGHPGLVVESCEGLVGLVQNGVVELHAPSARIRAPRRPDRIVLDLDPDPALPLEAVREEALRLNGLLERVGLASFVKTTGGKGLHVVVPVSGPPRLDFPSVKAFTRALGHALRETPGSLVVLEMAKARRSGRIYFDDVRNRPGATAVLPYSVRARPGAPVAFPLTWARLRRMRPPFSPGAADALRRLAREKAAAWPDLDAIRQPLHLSDETTQRAR
jgi:bifunctional non-homologous end joining protein LigD